MRVIITAAFVATVALSQASAQIRIVYGNNASFGPDVVEKFDIDTGAVLQTYVPSSGNGRGVVVVGNTIYSTEVDNPNIFLTDATTGAPMGTILTSQASMSTLAWDGSTFWTTDYSGTNQGFQINLAGQTIKTVSFSQSTSFMDGMEYFNGMLIVNNTDGGFGGPNAYSIYDLDGNLLVPDFLTAPNGTGIAYDGVNFLVSDIFADAINIYDGTTGAFVESRSLEGAHLIEDLSVNYADRPDTGCRLDFETDDLSTPLLNGQAIDTEFSQSVTITSSGPNAGAAIFDSTPGGPNDPSQDGDLLVDCGNILMLQTLDETTQTIPGIFDHPNDEADGGTLNFAFDPAVAPRSVDLIDVDTGANETTSVTLTDLSGLTRVYSVPAMWTGDLLVDGSSGKGTLALNVLTPQPGFGSTATAVEEEGFDGASVVAITIQRGSSGGVDNLNWCPESNRAASFLRNGSNTNPMILSSAALPRLGSVWTANLDCSGTGSGIASLEVRRRATLGMATPGGEALIGGALLYRTRRAYMDSMSQLEWNIPSDITLVGLCVHAQGLCQGTGGASSGPRGYGQVILSNAMDLVLGF